MRDRHRRCRQTAADHLPVSDRKGRDECGQSTRGHVAPSRLANRPHPALRICREEVPMVVSIRVRQVLIAVIALLPLVLAACNNGNSSGY